MAHSILSRHLKNKSSVFFMLQVTMITDNKKLWTLTEKKIHLDVVQNKKKALKTVW